MFSPTPINQLEEQLWSGRQAAGKGTGGAIRNVLNNFCEHIELKIPAHYLKQYSSSQGSPRDRKASSITRNTQSLVATQCCANSTLAFLSLLGINLLEFLCVFSLKPTPKTCFISYISTLPYVSRSRHMQSQEDTDTFFWVITEKGSRETP